VRVEFESIYRNDTNQEGAIKQHADNDGLDNLGNEKNKRTHSIFLYRSEWVMDGITEGVAVADLSVLLLSAANVELVIPRGRQAIVRKGFVSFAVL
jgi:hypothetical protein